MTLCGETGAIARAALALCVVAGVAVAVVSGVLPVLVDRELADDELVDGADDEVDAGDADADAIDSAVTTGSPVAVACDAFDAGLRTIVAPTIATVATSATAAAPYTA